MAHSEMSVCTGCAGSLGQKQVWGITLGSCVDHNVNVCMPFKDIWALRYRIWENFRGCLNLFNEINKLHEAGIKWRERERKNTLIPAVSQMNDILKEH